MRITRPQDRVRPQEPARCSCSHYTETPEFHGKRRSGSGMGGHRAANHGNPFRHTGCIHSELARTTKATRSTEVVMRIRL